MDVWGQVAGLLGLRYAQVSEESMSGYSFYAFRREIDEPISAGKLMKDVAWDVGGFTMNDREIHVVTRGFAMPDVLVRWIDALVLLVDAFTPR